MNNIRIFGAEYQLPVIKDERFKKLQDSIRARRDELDRLAKGTRSFLAPRRTADPEERIAMMEALVHDYQSLIHELGSKITVCRAAFEQLAQGVEAEFLRRLAELEDMERQRAALAGRMAAAGKPEAALAMDGNKEAIRSMVKDLTQSTILILRKLKHALLALELLAGDDEAQQEVYERLQGDLVLYRDSYNFNKELVRLGREIESITNVARSFDRVLRDSLGPLAELIDEITAVDTRLGESMAEIERISAELESGRSVPAGSELLGESILDLLVGNRIKSDQLDSIVQRIAAPDDALVSALEVDIISSMAADLDFSALAANMRELVEKGLELATTQGTGAKGALAMGERIAVASAGTALAGRQSPAGVGTNPESGSFGHAESSTVSAATNPSPEPAAEAAWSPPPPRSGAGLWTADRAPYRAAISRSEPSLVLFLLDRSGSMDTQYVAGQSRAAYLASVVDLAIAELATRCTKADGIRDYFHLAALGYGNGKVGTAFGGTMPSGSWQPVSVVAQRTLSVSADANGLARPHWIEVQAYGDTPMNAALREACALVARWCDQYPDSYPPTVINITDGEPTDGDPEPAADILRQLHTNDGPVLLFNLHVGSGGGECIFPDLAAAKKLDANAQLLYRMSSSFPPHLLDAAAAAGYHPAADARFFAWGAGAELATRFLSLGTRPARLA